MGRPICDTPGCGRTIPVGGEGHPEICPKCLADLKDLSPPVAESPKEPTWVNDLAERWLCDMRLESMADLLAVIREARAKALGEAAEWVDDAEGSGISADFKFDFADALKARRR